MSTGVVTSVTPRRAGATLTADVVNGDTVLLVEDAGEFAEDAGTVERWLVIGQETTPRRYIAVQNDEDAQQSITLDDPVIGFLGLGGLTVVEAGIPVTPYDPDADAADKRAVQHRVQVRLDSDGRTVPATLPHTVATVASAFALVGAHVRLDVRETGEVYVAEVMGRDGVLGSEVEVLRLRYPSGRPAGTIGNLGDGSVGIQLLSDEDTPSAFFTVVRDFYNVDNSLLQIDDVDYVLLQGNLITSLFSGDGNKYVSVSDDGGVRLEGAGKGVESSGMHTMFDGLTVNDEINYMGAPVTSDAANVNFNFSNGRLRIVTSSKRFKQDIEPVAIDPAAVLQLVGKTWRDKAEVEADPDTTSRYVGVIAEDLDDLGLTEFVTYDEEQRPHAVKYDRLFVALLAVARHQEQQQSAQDDRIADLEQQVTRLTERLDALTTEGD